MQAIILAAGMGKRLKALTNDNTKCMIKVNGVSLIERMLTQLDVYDFERIIIVTGYKGKELTEYISTLHTHTPIVYVDNPVYDKTNNIYSLYLAREYLTQSDTLLLESDLIFESGALDTLLENPYPNLALVAKYESWMDGTVITITQGNQIGRFIPKKDFCYSEISSYYKTVNIYKFSKAFSVSHYVPFLEAYIKALGENEYYEQVLRVITFLDKPEIKAVVLENSSWYEIDDIQDLDIAESIFVDEENKWNRMNSRYGGFWRYPKLLDYCYLVNPYYPNRQLVDELRASFETLLCEYPSGLRINTLLAAKYFGVAQEHICIGNGASELIKAFMETLEGKVGIVRPSFEEYFNRYKEDGVVAFVPNNPDFAYTADDLIRYFKGKPIQTLLIVNPDNPSGNFIEKADILRLADWTKQEEIQLLVDESFVDFACAEETQTLLHDEVLGQYPNLVVMKSISKSYGVPGLRLGVIASGDISLISKIKESVAIWNINSIGEFYMQICEKYLPEYRSAIEKIQQVRSALQQDLGSIKYLRVIPSQANYIMCEVTGKMTAHRLCIKLLDQHNILIKDLSNKGGINGQYVRIAVKDTADNEHLISALKAIEMEDDKVFLRE